MEKVLRSEGQHPRNKHLVLAVQHLVSVVQVVLPAVRRESVRSAVKERLVSCALSLDSSLVVGEHIVCFRQRSAAPAHSQRFKTYSSVLYLLPSLI